MKGVPFLDFIMTLVCIATLTTAPPLGVMITLICVGVVVGRRNETIQGYLIGDNPRNLLIDYVLPPKQLTISVPTIPKQKQEDISEGEYTIDINQELVTSPVSSQRLPIILPLHQWLEIVNDKIDDAPHTLIIGDTGAGKTTLAQAVLSDRDGIFVIADPKPKPGKWGNLPFVSIDSDGECKPIDTLFNLVLREIKVRLDQMREGKEDFTPLTVVVDEWPFVKAECPDTAPLLLKRLGSIGRELRVRLIALTQSDRVKSLGIEGEGDARGNFTIIRLGKPAIQSLPLTRSMERPACLEWKGEFLAISTQGVMELGKRNISQDRLWNTAAVATLFNANIKNTLHSGTLEGLIIAQKGNAEQSRVQSEVSEYDLLEDIVHRYEVDKEPLVRTLLQAGYTHAAVKDELKKAGYKIDNNKIAEISKELKKESRV